MSDPFHNVYDDHRQVPFRHQYHIGHGGQATVDAVERTFGPPGGKLYARKIFILSNTPKASELDSILQEIKITASLRHAHVVSLVETYQYRNTYAIIMDPVAEGNLAVYLSDLDSTPEAIDNGRRDQLSRWFGCLANAVAFLHAENIHHRDIKPLNILTMKENILLTDFGISKTFQEKTVTGFTDTVGTRTYRSPEMDEGFRPGRRADIFSLGAVFLEMITVASGFGRLDKFRSFRGGPYSENIEKVQAWIQALSNNGCKEPWHLTILILCYQMLGYKREERIYTEDLTKCWKDQSVFVIPPTSCSCGARSTDERFRNEPSEGSPQPYRGGDGLPAYLREKEDGLFSILPTFNDVLTIFEYALDELDWENLSTYTEHLIIIIYRQNNIYHMVNTGQHLQTWDGLHSGFDFLLEHPTQSKSHPWDQFSANADLFGVKSDYDESYYTTKIDRHHPQYAERLARAEKIAREIENGAPLNDHTLDEKEHSSANNRVKNQKDEEINDGSAVLRLLIKLIVDTVCNGGKDVRLYAKLCANLLKSMPPEIVDVRVPPRNGLPVVGGALFRKYLLNYCQELFERGATEGQTLRWHNLILFFGALYTERLMVFRIVHERIAALLSVEGPTERSAIETFVELMGIVGGLVSTEKLGKEMNEVYLERAKEKLVAPNIRFDLKLRLKYIYDLGNAGWDPRNIRTQSPGLREILPPEGYWLFDEALQLLS